MRRIFGFFSLVALAVLAAGALGVAGLGPLSGDLSTKASAQNFAFEYRSFLLGTVFGVVLASIGRWPWAEMPRRAITWVVQNERRIIRCGYAAMFVAVLLYY